MIEEISLSLFCRQEVFGFDTKQNDQEQLATIIQ